MDLSGLGRLLMLAGAVLFALGAAFAWAPRTRWLGRLPGDFHFGSGDTHVYVPLGTSLLVSVLVTLLLHLFFRRR